MLAVVYTCLMRAPHHPPLFHPRNLSANWFSTCVYDEKQMGKAEWHLRPSICVLKYSERRWFWWGAKMRLLWSKVMWLLGSWASSHSSPIGFICIDIYTKANICPRSNGHTNEQHWAIPISALVMELWRRARSVGCSRRWWWCWSERVIRGLFFSFHTNILHHSHIYFTLPHILLAIWCIYTDTHKIYIQGICRLMSANNSPPLFSALMPSLMEDTHLHKYGLSPWMALCKINCNYLPVLGIV